MIESAASLKFERKPSPVLAEHRPLYKIGQILLVLHLASRGGRSKLPRLHLFNWALKSKARQVQLIEASTSRVLRVSAWGFDPMLAFAVSFAIAEGLIRETSTGYELAEDGESFVLDILREEELFAAEKTFLGVVGKGITEAMVETVANGWEA